MPQGHAGLADQCGIEAVRPDQQLDQAHPGFAVANGSVRSISAYKKGSVAGFCHATLATTARLLHHKREKPLADGNNPPGFGAFPCSFVPFFPPGQK